MSDQSFPGRRRADPGGVSRRTVLKGVATLGAGVGLAACGWRPGQGWFPRARLRPPGSRPFPRLPEGVVQTTRSKYLDAFRLLTGRLPSGIRA